MNNALVASPSATRMDRDRWRRRFVEDGLPYLGLAIGVVALTGGVRAFVAGVEGAGLVGYAVGTLTLAGGYGAISRGVGRRLDRVYYLSVVVAVAGLAYTFGVLDPPPTVFELAAG